MLRISPTIQRDSAVILFEIVQTYVPYVTSRLATLYPWLQAVRADMLVFKNRKATRDPGT